MFWQFLNHWWNLPSLVLLGLVAVYFVSQAIGLIGPGGDAEGDHDHELDHELGPEVDADGDGGLDAPAEASPEHDHEHEAGDGEGDGEDDGDDSGSALGSLAAFLGVGRVPFMVVWLTLFIFAGFTGLFANKIVWDVLGHAYPGWFFPLSLALSGAAGVVATRFAARVVGRFVDVGGRGASRKKDLAGQVGVVASPRLDAEFGEVRVKDERGDEHIVHARLEAGAGALPQGARVVLTDHDDERDLFTAAPLDQ